MTGLLTPAFSDERGDAIGDWMPARYSPTLTGSEEFFYTAGDQLLSFAVEHWRTVESDRLDLDAWQVWVIRRLLEVYPPWWPVVELRGRLRYKEVVISLARQNGKSVIGALIVLYFLTAHRRGPKVGMFASKEEQARIVYNRVLFAAEHSPAVGAVLRGTKTRGIHRRDGRGMAATFPAKEEALQGEPFTGCLYDELHLGNMGLWDAIKIGQRSVPSGLIVGITTAGDDDSLLLKRLYTEGDNALTGVADVIDLARAVVDRAEAVVAEEYDRLTAGVERFGFFVWEAADDELTPENIVRANPAVACGRIPLRDVLADSRKTWKAGPDEHGVTGRDRVIRYTLNRFVEGAADAWIASAAFNARAGIITEMAGNVTYGIERTAAWEHATITASASVDGHLYSEVVATIAGASHDVLKRACKELNARSRSTFAMPADTLSDLGKSLREDGLEVWTLGVTEMVQATASVKSAVARDGLTHAGDPIVRYQSARAKVRTSDGGDRISRSLTTGDTDALLAMIAGTFVAEIAGKNVKQFH